MRRRPRYLVELAPSDDGVPPDAVRLRKLLKSLGRYHGLDCLGVRQLPDAAAEALGAAPDGPETVPAAP